MRCRLFTHWSISLDSWINTTGYEPDRAPWEFTAYLSCVWESIPGVEECQVWFYTVHTGPARIVDGRIVARMHWSVDVPTEAWRAWRAEYDRGRPVLPGIRRDALRYLAGELYVSGSIAPTDAVMTVTRAREGRRPAWQTIADPIHVYRPEGRIPAAPGACGRRGG